MTYNKLLTLILERRYELVEHFLQSSRSIRKMSTVKYHGDLPIVMVMKCQGPDSTILALLEVYPKCVMDKDASGKTILHIAKESNCSNRVIRKLKEVLESIEKLANSSSSFHSDKPEKRASISSLLTNISGDYFEERREYFRSQRSIRISSINLNEED